MTRIFRDRLVFTCLAVALAGVAVLQQGCYRRVVAVKGLGGSNYEVSEPYQQNSKIDDWMFGPQKTPGDVIKTPPPPK